MEKQETPKKDDLNAYLTWGNVAKVVIFLCTPIFFIAKQTGKDTIKEYEMKSLMTSTEEINKNVKDIKTQNEAYQKEINQRIQTLELNFQAIQAEFKYLKEQIQNNNRR